MFESIIEWDRSARAKLFQELGVRILRLCLNFTEYPSEQQQQQ